MARPLLTFLLTAALFVPVAAPAYAGDMAFAAGGASYRIKVQSLLERKFGTVVRQQYDFSCGSAALATLLTHHYGRPITETDAFRAMWEVGDQDRIRQLGFSLLEMKGYLENIGLRADGFRLSVDRIAEIGVPGIALIEVNGYRHFVVVKGVTGRRVLLGDPSKGLLTKSRREFEKVWDGTILYIRSEVAMGKDNFNSVADWRLIPGAPFDRANDLEPLQSSALHATRPAFSGFTIPSNPRGAN
jgi:predicted double-glycine peptidase